MSTPVGKWEKEDIVSRKLRIYPSKHQRHILKQWMGTRRYVYNKALEKIKNGEDVNFYQLRNQIVTAKNNETITDWEIETPKDIRAGAIRDLVKNHKTAFSNLKNGNIRSFNMSYCKKKHCPSIEIPKTAIKLDNGLSIYKRYITDKIKISKKDNINYTIEYDCRLQYKNNRWFLIIPIKREVRKINNRVKWCSLDPGVRTFQTIYSDESITQIKVRKDIVKKLQEKLDLFKSLRDKKIITSSRYSRKERNIYFRMNNLIDDLHYKTCNYLTKTFDHIILPSFDSQEMVRKSKNKSLNRDLLQLKHYLFKERLVSKCKLMSCTLDICTEEFTSKTCGVCGCINDVGTSDILRCNKCNVVIDRDVNGARNIAIKRFNELR